MKDLLTEGPGALSALESCVGERRLEQLLLQVGRLMRSRVEHRLGDRTVSLDQCLALKLLDEGLAENARDLARDLGMTSSGVTRLLDSLEDRGWIERGRSADDRRQYHLTLTPEGIREIRRLQPDLVASWSEIRAIFVGGEFDEFVRLLTLLRQGLLTTQPQQLEPAG